MLTCACKSLISCMWTGSRSGCCRPSWLSMILGSSSPESELESESEEDDDEDEDEDDRASRATSPCAALDLDFDTLRDDLRCGRPRASRPGIVRSVCLDFFFCFRSLKLESESDPVSEESSEDEEDELSSPRSLLSLGELALTRLPDLRLGLLLEAFGLRALPLESSWPLDFSLRPLSMPLIVVSTAC